MKPNSAIMKTARTPATASAQRKLFDRMNCHRPEFGCPCMTSTAIDRIQRNMSGGRTKDESGAANILDHRRLVRSVHLMTQAAHMHVDQVCRRDEFVVPDFLEQHG